LKEGIIGFDEIYQLDGSTIKRFVLNKAEEKPEKQRKSVDLTKAQKEL
jgi:hypothetical protein